MTTFEQIDQALDAHGWRYQASHEQFYEGNRELTWKDVPLRDTAANQLRWTLNTDGRGMMRPGDLAGDETTAMVDWTRRRNDVPRRYV